MKSSTNTLNLLVLSTDSSEGEQITIPVVNSPRRRARRASHSAERLQSAVYAYIRAIRALGRTQINTLEIAAALSLSLAEVNRAISSLGKKGVKVSNG